MKSFCVASVFVSSILVIVGFVLGNAVKQAGAQLLQTEATAPESKTPEQLAWEERVKQAIAIAGDEKPQVIAIPENGWALVVTPAGTAYCISQSGQTLPLHMMVPDPSGAKPKLYSVNLKFDLLRPM